MPGEVLSVSGEPGTSAAKEPDVEFTRAMRELQNPKRWGAGLLLVVSLALFVVTRNSLSTSSNSLVVIVGVLLLHELGHYAGMRLFGYRDVRMFFIPLFGAAVSGRPVGVASWKEGIVLLLGPVPGIVVAFVLMRDGGLSASARQLALSLVSINAFNLLPLAGLDGARLLQRVLFSRRRWIEILFQLCASLAMAAYAMKFEVWALGFLAYLMLATLPHRWRILGAALKLRAGGVVLPSDPRRLEGETARVVFVAARGTLTHPRAKATAAVMEQLVDAVNTRPPAFAASAALAGVWALSLVFGFVTLRQVTTPRRPHTDWSQAAVSQPWQNRLELRRPRLLDNDENRPGSDSP